jgi:dTDP-4-amino-4,6-dideoxygalactose transaminase
MDALLAVARARGLFVLEDACQAIGAGYKGRPAGTLGDCAAFSFYPTKNLGGFGEGGMITTADDGLAEKLRVLRVHGMRERYYHDEVGINSRLDSLKCLVLEKKLPHLARWNERRRAIADQYDELLAHPDVLTPTVASGNTHIYHQYVIRVRGGKRERVTVHMKERGVGFAIFYPVPLHLQPCFAELGYGKGDLPQAELAADEVLALPVFPELTDEEVREVAETVLGGL